MRVPLLNFEGGPGVLLLNFEAGPWVPLLNFEGGPGFQDPEVLFPLLHHASPRVKGQSARIYRPVFIDKHDHVIS